jgi:hypothetical protein
MNHSAKWLLSLLCCFFLLNEAEAKRTAEPEQPQINQKAIQEGVLSFADSWLSQVSQGYQAFEAQVETPELRVAAKKLRFGAITSAVEIATVPFPGRALLDMMVLASLNRATWERH